MNLSAQDHQTFFTCETDFLRPSDTVMQKAWRERNPPARIKAAYQALELNNDCATAYVLLAEEEATTIVDAERLFKQALRAGEIIYRRSQQCQHQSPQHEAQLRRDTNVLVYIKRRLAMCARKLGRIREAVKIMRDLMKEFPPLTMLNIHENLLESLLELQAYADVQAVLAKYDDISLPKSAAICYTAALLKTRTVSDKFSPETAFRKGLSTAEINAVEAIHRAVEFNPHVPKVRFFITKILLLFKLNKFMTVDQNVRFVLHQIRIVLAFSLHLHLKRHIKKAFRMTRTGDAALLIAYLCCIHSPDLSLQCHENLAWLVHASNPTTWEVEAKGSDVQDHSLYFLYSEFEASLEHSSPCIKIRKLKATWLDAISSPWVCNCWQNKI
ncbi:suppressor of tumorigenicity 7 protein-like isoform X2 [Rattus norvegicus]